MSFNLTKYFKNFFLTGHERSIRAKKNIALSFVLKSINIIIQILFVPLLLGYLNPVKYGIWLTVASVINWFNFFDIGLGNGLRNKLAESLARDQKELARIYISTTYVALSVIVILFYLVFLLVDKFINWQAVFNAPENLGAEVDLLIIVVFTFSSINFIARLIGSILNAIQKSAINELIYTSGNILAFILIYSLSFIGDSSLVLIGASIGFATFLPALIITLVFFGKYFKQIKPSLKFVKFAYINELTSLGLKFFVMQITTVIVFTTDNIIITQLFGPAEVTPYNIALKYFNVVQIGFSIIITPFWSAFTEAYTHNDYNWIKQKIKQLIKIWLILDIFIFIMLILSNDIYHLWVGNEVEIEYSLSILMAIFVLIATWSNIFAFFINGIGLLKLSIITSTINIVINIPLSILLAKDFSMGINGIILGTCICLSIGAILKPWQYYNLINHKANGIWNE